LQTDTECQQIHLFLFNPGLPPPPALFPYTTLFRSLPELCLAQYSLAPKENARRRRTSPPQANQPAAGEPPARRRRTTSPPPGARSEEHTSELQSRENLVCRLLLEKKKEQHSDGFLA